MTADSARPFLSAIVRTQGRRPRSLAEAVDSLRAQDDDDLEIVVVVHGDEARRTATERELGDRVVAADALPPVRVVGVSGGGRARPLNAGMAAARGHYVAFLDDDDLARPDWVAAFRAGAAEAPDHLVRAASETQHWRTDADGQPLEPVDDPHREFPDTFDLLAHFARNLTPICSIALPLRAARDRGLEFAEELPVLEDWDLIMRAALDLGIVSVPRATSLYRRGNTGGSASAADELSWAEAHAAVIARLDARTVCLPPGSAQRLARAEFTTGGDTVHRGIVEERIAHDPGDERTRRLAAELRHLEVRRERDVARLRAERDAERRLRIAYETSPWWRATGPLRRLAAWVTRGRR
ncbi:MAG: glycosyltransferase [Actinomyces sp.]|nr:MAG: glycosyltransferase [Actinomyces sp.]